MIRSMSGYISGTLLSTGSMFCTGKRFQDAEQLDFALWLKG